MCQFVFSYPSWWEMGEIVIRIRDNYKDKNTMRKKGVLQMGLQLSF
jgi:hypothetical protein